MQPSSPQVDLTMFQKRYRLYVLAALTSLAIALYHAEQAPKAFAGGFDRPGMGDSESVMPDGKPKKLEPPLNFDWRRWSRPYMQGAQMCRAYHGNVVCLTPQIAQQMGWLSQQKISKISQNSFSKFE